MKKADSQGHRLSSYASSSLNKSPKTPKKSIEKLDTENNGTNSTGKKESLSPHHLLTGYSFSNINQQSPKSGERSERVLKCTCNASYNSLKSPKFSSEKLDKQLVKLSKIRCDAATSPNRNGLKSPRVNVKIAESTKETQPHRNELCISDDRKVTSKLPSPRRLVATRNAATSPHLDVRKQQLSPKQCIELIPKSILVGMVIGSDLTPKQILEKSNSLGETKPTRPLRTTRSLSPRPPVRHQHAITVSDENDIVSVKISPNEEFLDEYVNEIPPISPKILTPVKEKHKAQSEQTSPNISDFDTTFVYEKSANNKSTGCLVYVPSDPWMKMTDFKEEKPTKNKKKNTKLCQESRSLSRGNFQPIEDPWVWRKSTDGSMTPTKTTPSKSKSAKQDVYQQRKSFSMSAAKNELSSSTDYLFSTPTKVVPVKPTSVTPSKTKTKNPPASSNTNSRPKLQRSKSPINMEDTCTKTCTCSKLLPDKSPCLVPSPRKDRYEEIFVTSPPAVPMPQSPIPKVSITSKSPATITATMTASPPTAASSSASITQNAHLGKTFLNVTNPNLLQARHSFSSISKKDDELQLNIRRLSEQIKNNPSSTVADFNDYLTKFRSTGEHQTSSINSSMQRKSSKDADPVLETTC